MKTIFEQGSFENYSKIRIDEARASIPPTYEYSSRKPTVFISHKHDDLEDLKGLIGFLESNFNVKAYIDSRDPSMPPITSEKTAETIKDRIKTCNKFILLATNGAVESKWCNWELGYGDAQKYKNHIALFPLKPRDSYDYNYKGSEYMRIYPHIAYYDGTEKYTNGHPVKQGYYVVSYKTDGYYITSLAEWFLL